VTGPRSRKQSQANAVRDSALASVDVKLAAARDLFSAALIAHVRGRSDAAARTREALDAIQQARDQLASLGDDGEA
jgi:hypothetical protein